MISVNVKNKIITISGHANYNNYGNDIVCASASSIIYTTVNGIININKNAIEFTDENKMTIKILIDDEIINKLIDNMLLLLEDLCKQYPKNIKISKGE